MAIRWSDRSDEKSAAFGVAVAERRSVILFPLDWETGMATMQRLVVVCDGSVAQPSMTTSSFARVLSFVTCVG